MQDSVIFWLNWGCLDHTGHVFMLVWACSVTLCPGMAFFLGTACNLSPLEIYQQQSTEFIRYWNYPKYWPLKKITVIILNFEYEFLVNTIAGQTEISADPDQTAP